ncbi:MFS transporter, partial [Nocardioides sp.]|uniref:MFS transporter n=1 Tax=Nocardioides sp. TaxID=35761 RepID=UPI003569F9EC
TRAALLLALAVGAVALGLVRGGEWGWGRTETVASFAVALLAGALFARHNALSTTPFLDPTMLRVPSYAWANAATFLFNAAFAAGLLANVLWMQSVWGYSAIRTGIAVAPGPLLVPVFAVVAQRLSFRFAVGRIAAVGSLLVAGSALYAIAVIGQEPSYLTEVLPGWLLAGVGVGLAMPTILAAGTSSLPAERTATGTAVVNMSRQIGAVLGVSLLIALLGTPIGYAAAHSAFVDIWWMTAGFSVLAAGAALGLRGLGGVSEPTPSSMQETAVGPGKI